MQPREIVISVKRARRGYFVESDCVVSLVTDSLTAARGHARRLLQACEFTEGLEGVEQVVGRIEDLTA